MTALKSLLFLILAAGLGAGYIPFVLLPSGPQAETGLFAYLAFPLWLLGGAMILWCFWVFTFKGHGTPNPIDPPKELVAIGPYRYVRNPMISGVTFVLFGEALVLLSTSHFMWGVTFAAINLIYIPLLEEPMLQRRFGGEYDEYCRHVPRLFPRLQPYASDRP